FSCDALYFRWIELTRLDPAQIQIGIEDDAGHEPFPGAETLIQSVSDGLSEVRLRHAPPGHLALLIHFRNGRDAVIGGQDNESIAGADLPIYVIQEFAE